MIFSFYVYLKAVVCIQKSIHKVLSGYKFTKTINFANRFVYISTQKPESNSAKKLKAIQYISECLIVNFIITSLKSLRCNFRLHLFFIWIVVDFSFLQLRISVVVWVSIWDSVRILCGQCWEICSLCENALSFDVRQNEPFCFGFELNKILRILWCSTYDDDDDDFYIRSTFIFRSYSFCESVYLWP